MNWTSHRGLCEEGCVDNTRQSFSNAIRAGFTAIETDLRCTRDGVIVLHHDRTMDRTAGCSKKIDEIDYDEFRSTRLLDGQYGMSFMEFVDAYAAFHWILDIKAETAREVISQLKLWCVEKGAQHWFLSHSRFLLWSERDESFLKGQFPQATTLAKELECHRAGLSLLVGLGVFSGLKKGRTYALPPQFLGLKLFKKSFIEKYHKRGAKVLAYLPEGEEDIAAAIEAGVDEILINGKPCKPNMSS